MTTTRFQGTAPFPHSKKKEAEIRFGDYFTLTRLKIGLGSLIHPTLTENPLLIVIEYWFKEFGALRGVIHDKFVHNFLTCH